MAIPSSRRTRLESFPFGIEIPTLTGAGRKPLLRLSGNFAMNAFCASNGLEERPDYE
jgi:hypothetical protein